MAKIKSGLTASFRSGAIRNAINEQIKEYETKVLTTLKFVGEKFVNAARMDGNYTDRTGNLRSSIGYIILKDGRVITQNFSGNPEGVEAGKEIAFEVGTKIDRGFVLIGVAGMEYAAAVESRNFDVITGSAPTVQTLKNIFNEVDL